MKVDLSVIITISSRQKLVNVSELFSVYKSTLEKSGLNHEFVFVTEDINPVQLNKLFELSRTEPGVKIIKLAKWFGNATALRIGFENASGNTILTLPVYQQVEANEILRVLNELENCDLAIGRRSRKKDNVFQRVQAKVFHSLVNFLIGMNYHDLGCNVRAFRKEVLENIHLYGDQNRFFPLLANRLGFRVREVDVAQYQSGAVRRIYSFGHYTERFVDLISIFFLIKFTRKPLRFFGVPGIIIFALGSILSLYLFYQRIFMDVPLADKPMVLVSVLLIVFGIQLFAIGLVAEIIIFTHSKDSKEYIVEKVVDHNNPLLAEEAGFQEKLFR